jgi:hypothetical protein
VKFCKEEQVRPTPSINLRSLCARLRIPAKAGHHSGARKASVPADAGPGEAVGGLSVRSGRGSMAF